MSDLPRVESYGRYSSGNYGTHCLRVEVGPLTLWFSYRTLVAFRRRGAALIVSENCWGPTTGKHLRWIDDGDKKARVARGEFERLWRETAAAFGLGAEMFAA